MEKSRNWDASEFLYIQSTSKIQFRNGHIWHSVYINSQKHIDKAPLWKWYMNWFSKEISKLHFLYWNGHSFSPSIWSFNPTSCSESRITYKKSKNRETSQNIARAEKTCCYLQSICSQGEGSIVWGNILSQKKLQDGVLEEYIRRILPIADERYVECALPVLTEIYVRLLHTNSQQLMPLYTDYNSVFEKNCKLTSMFLWQ